MDANKQIKYSSYQISDNVKFGGLMDLEQCKALAKKILSLYDGDQNGTVDSFEVGYMQSDCYRAMNKGFNPTPTDIAAYSRVIDTQGKGRINYADIEALVIKYFGGDVSRQEGPQTVEPPQAVQSNRSFEAVNTRTQEIRNSGTQSQYSRQINVTTTNVVSSVNYGQQQLQSSYQPPERLQPQPQLQPVQAPAFQSQQPPKQYSKQVQERLEVARRIFKMLDKELLGYITEKQVPYLLIETYKQMNISYSPTQEDVELWMEMADTDRDGRVYLADYENLVLNSLKQQGIVLE